MNALDRVSPWVSFYVGRTGDDYLGYAKQRYMPFIATILANLRYRDIVLEIGCGTGTITRALADHLPRNLFTLAASDIDKQMLAIAHQRLKDTDAITLPHDARKPFNAPANVVHSHGLLEHFDDATIRKVINAHRGARVQLHYVPGQYDKPSFGDERLMSAEQWRELCAPDQIVPFNDGLDYILIFEGKK